MAFLILVLSVPLQSAFRPTYRVETMGRVTRWLPIDVHAYVTRRDQPLTNGKKHGLARIRHAFPSAPKRRLAPGRYVIAWHLGVEVPPAVQDSMLPISNAQALPSCG
jgi:hypothetical protein